MKRSFALALTPAAFACALLAGMGAWPRPALPAEWSGHRDQRARDSPRGRALLQEHPGDLPGRGDSGIATNSKGNVYVFHRANETRLFEYSPQGVFTREFGKGLYGFAFAHAVRVDAQDNVWAVDEGTDM